MLAISRFKITLGEAAEFRSNLSTALSSLAACPGYLKGEFGQNLDDLTLWALVTHWENVGSYRRALSSTAVKIAAVPILARAIDEPGAYESSLSE